MKKKEAEGGERKGEVLSRVAPVALFFGNTSAIRENRRGYEEICDSVSNCIKCVCVYQACISLMQKTVADFLGT